MICNMLGCVVCSVSQCELAIGSRRALTPPSLCASSPLGHHPSCHSVLGLTQTLVSSKKRSNAMTRFGCLKLEELWDVPGASTKPCMLIS